MIVPGDSGFKLSPVPLSSEKVRVQRLDFSHG